jgi:hypothetical protein
MTLSNEKLEGSAFGVVMPTADSFVLDGNDVDIFGRDGSKLLEKRKSLDRRSFVLLSIWNFLVL